MSAADHHPALAPSPVAMARAHAELLLGAGASASAVLDLLLATLRQHGEDAGLLSDISVILFQTGADEAGNAFLERAVALDPDHEDVNANIRGLWHQSLATGTLPPQVVRDHLPQPAVVGDHGLLGGGEPESDAPAEPRLRVAVIGAESSGTRMMSEILSQAGCEVLHRSFPYEAGPARHWPVEAVEEYGPDAVVVMTRDWWAAVPSQVAGWHVVEPDEAWDNLREAWQRIGEAVAGRRWCAVSFESLVQRPRTVVGNVCEWLGVPLPDFGEVFDANERWLGPAETPAPVPS